MNLVFSFVFAARGSMYDRCGEDDWKYRPCYMPPPVHVCRNWSPTLQGLRESLSLIVTLFRNFYVIMMMISLIWRKCM